MFIYDLNLFNLFQIVEDSLCFFAVTEWDRLVIYTSEGFSETVFYQQTCPQPNSVNIWKTKLVYQWWWNLRLITCFFSIPHNIVNPTSTLEYLLVWLSGIADIGSIKYKISIVPYLLYSSKVFWALAIMNEAELFEVFKVS